MSIGSGLGGSFGIANETVYGTYVAPSRFYDTKDKLPDVKKVKNVAQGGGLAAGRMGQLASRRVVTTESGGFTIPTEVTNAKMGLLLSHIFGGAVAPVQQGASAAYLQTHPLVDNVGRFFSAQAGVPDTTGTVRPYTARGCKVLSAEFTCDVDGLLMVSIGVDGQKVVDTDTLAAPSYGSSLWPFHFGQMAVKVGASAGAESSVSGVKSVSVKIERGMDVGRFYAGGAGLKAEPLMNDWVKVSGSLNADFLDKTVFADRFAADTQTALVFEWVASTPIVSTYYPTFRLKLPANFFNGDTPVVEGPGVVSGAFPFDTLYDGTNAQITGEYMSTDTTL